MKDVTKHPLRRHRLLPRRQVLDSVPLAILNKLNALSALDADDVALVRGAVADAAFQRSQSVVVTDGATFEQSRLLISGWACRMRTSEKHRHVLDFYLPGDILGYCPRPKGRTSAPYVALTNVQTASAAPLHRLFYSAPTETIKAATLQLEQLHESLLLNQIARFGQTARERVGNLYLEFLFRMNLCGLAPSQTFILPLTQKSIASGISLSPVHVNRTLHELRDEGLVRVNHRIVTIPDANRLALEADFKDPIAL